LPGACVVTLAAGGMLAVRLPLVVEVLARQLTCYYTKFCPVAADRYIRKHTLLPGKRAFLRNFAGI